MRFSLSGMGHWALGMGIGNRKLGMGVIAEALFDDNKVLVVKL